MSRTLTRWTVPATVAVAVLGVAAAATALRASADPSLAPRSAAQLLVDLQTAKLEGLSGTVVQRADLGLPALPMLGASGSGQLASLISGSHTLRVWYSGPDKTRIALLGTLGESDIIRNGPDVWYWSSEDQSATHHRLPDGSGRSTVDKLPVTPDLVPTTPQELADRVLAALEPSTVVSTSGTTKVAGRAAYELVLAPRDSASLVSQVRLAIDGERHLPLRVQVLAKGQAAPAFEVGFTQVSFQRPGDEHFTFTPPAGTRVTEEGKDAGHPDKTMPRQPDDPAPVKPAPDQPTPDQPTPDGSGPTVVGSGWTSVLVAKIPLQADGTKDMPFGALLTTLQPVQGAWGSGHLLRSKLFTVLVTDDGRILAGAVTPERLYAVAAANR